MAFSLLPMKISSLCLKSFRNVALSKELGCPTSHYFLSSRFSSRHTVQMRGLDYDTTEKDIIDFFRPLGITPSKVHLKCDGGGRTASVSEVEFNSHAEAVVAMRKRNAFIGNRFIRLTLKSTAAESVKKQEDDSPSSNTSNRVGWTVEDKGNASPIPGGHAIRMKNAPWRITDQAIYNFFRPVGAYVVSVKPVYDKNELRTGEFDVQFHSQDDIHFALTKNNSYLGNRFIELSLK